MQFSSFDDAWLGLGDTSKIQVDNEFLTNVKFETLGLDALRILRNPSNFSLTAKVFFNVDVLPMQAAILQELWSRPFPMYIASRGFGKAIFPDELVRVKNGWKKIKDIEVGDYVYGGDGRLARVSATTGIMHNLRMYDVYFEDGRKISCCKDHLWKVFDKHASKWVVIDTLQIYDGFQKGRYAIPINKPISDDDESIDEKEKRLYTQLDKCSTTLDGIYIVRDRVAANEVIDLARSIGLYVDVIYTDVGTIIQMYNKDIVNISNIKCCGLSDGCCIEVENDDHTYITKDYIVTHNSYLLGLYAMLRLLLIPGHKIVIVGAGFRQAKVIFEYMETLWHGADVLRSVCDAHSGPRRDIDRCTMYINDSVATAVPLGDGCLSKTTLTTYDDGFGYIDENYHTKIYGNTKFRDISDFHDNGVCDTKIVITKKGFMFEGTHNHKMKVLDGGEVVWKRADEMRVGDYILIDRSYRWHNGRFHLDENVAYQLGIDSFNKEMSKDILRADKETMSAYIRGIFDKYATIKYINGYIYLSLFCKNEKLARQLQYILLHYKVVCGLKVMSDGWVLDVNEEHALLLLQNIGLNDEYKHDMIEYFFDYISIISVNDVYYDVITDIQDGKAHTYDLCVPEDHEYCASGFYSHNTKIRGLRAHTIIGDEFNCDRCDTLIETNNGLHRIQDLMDKDDFHVVNKDGEYEKPHNNIITKPCDVYEIKMKYGYTIGCSANHIVMTQNGWKRILELDSNDYIICDNKYKFPDKQVDVVGEDLAWLMGVLIAEGYVNHKNYVTITSTDKDFIDRCVNITDKIGLISKVYTRDGYIDKRGWICKRRYDIHICNTEFRNKLLELGIGFSTAHQKKIPWSILQSPKNVILSFLSGLFEGDGSCFTFKTKQHEKILAVAYYTVSPVLAQDLQTLLLKLDIVCQRQTRESKISDNPQWMLRLNGENALNFVNMLNIQEWKDIAKHAYVRVKKDDCGVVYLKEKNKYRASICGLYGKRSTNLGSFDTKEEAIAVMQKLQQESPRGFKVKSVTKLPDQEVLYDFYLPQTHSFYGNGFVQHNSIPIDIYESVVIGFASVSADPISNVKEAARRKEMRKHGLWSETAEERYQDKAGNQAIISGTAGYGFQPFATYWKRYMSIIKSRGDEAKLKEIFGDEGPPENFSWKDYSIIRIPYEIVPEGFMDDKQVSRAKATIHSAIYASEYGACIKPDELIQTDSGCKKIKDIVVGDMVLTHKHRFRPVTKLYRRWFNNSIVEYKTCGYNRYIGVTSNHPCYIDDGWKNLGDIEKNTQVANLKELNNNKSINIVDYTDNYLYTHDKSGIYAMGTRCKLLPKQIDDIIASNKTQCDLAKIYGVRQSSISKILLNKKRPKGTVPTIINLNYDFGLIVGYYASEGSVGACGRQVGFALDGHVDNDLSVFVDELERAILNVFAIKAKRYRKNDNTLNITINNRIIADLLTKICPGICYNKMVNPSILYSNEDFLKGFIRGFWNGDGHKSKDRVGVCATSTSIDLINQLKIALSYFDISASIICKNGGQVNIKNKLYNTVNFYMLYMYGDQARKFIETIYDTSVQYTNIKQKLFSNNKYTISNIKDKRLVPYRGFVHNLEVDEDHSYSLINATVHNCFVEDSDGFFKRSLIESCVATTRNIGQPGWPKWCPKEFDARVVGGNGLRYIYGVDPASEVDNFSIVILELHPEHTRIVYTWSINRKLFKQRVSAGMATENDFYAFCARKIRDLMTIFPCDAIAMDAQGGGVAVEEALHDTDKLNPGEIPIWPVIEADKEKDTDIQAGLHILHLCQFAKGDWTAAANHGLRKDLEDKVLLFPRFDPVTIELSIEEDKRRQTAFQKANPDKIFNIYDTLEDCIMEIEELKNELCTIVMTRTGTGVGARDRWDTPEIKLTGGKKGRMRKDRYSALVMCNMVARSIQRATPPPEYGVIGGAVGTIDGEQGGQMYVGPDWFTKGMNDNVIFGVSRR